MSLQQPNNQASLNAALHSARMPIMHRVTKETCASLQRDGGSTVQYLLNETFMLTHPHEAWSYWRNACWCRPACPSEQWQTRPWSLSGRVAALCPATTTVTATSVHSLIVGFGDALEQLIKEDVVTFSPDCSPDQASRWALQQPCTCCQLSWSSPRRWTSAWTAAVRVTGKQSEGRVHLSSRPRQGPHD